jgi:hypothetical protein
VVVDQNAVLEIRQHLPSEIAKVAGTGFLGSIDATLALTLADLSVLPIWRPVIGG